MQTLKKVASTGITFLSKCLFVFRGLKSVISDYAPLFFKPGVVNTFMFVWMVISIVTLALLYNFNYNNIGFSKALVNFFHL